MSKSFDPKCYELAKSFLSDDPPLDTEENRNELAADIQTAIEDGIESLRLRVAFRHNIPVRP